MTYCSALKLEEGMVFGSDSRTNAGVDDIATFRKMKIIERPGDRVIAILSSGNLSVTQTTLSLLERHREGEGSFLTVDSLFDAAVLLGETLRKVQLREGPYLDQDRVDVSASFLIGGQIRGEEPRLFHVYNQGNFIEASPETPFFQIGETKYGKPILDRVITPETGLEDAAKCLLVSFDSTMRSNISVGPPIDLFCYVKDEFKIRLLWHIEEGDPYFKTLQQEWADGIRQTFASLSDLPKP